MNFIVGEYEGFNWDKGNSTKNWLKHEVSTQECEEIFFNQPIYIQEDAKHSSQEKRFFVLGQTSIGRKLFLVFTPRARLIRVINARPMSRKEKEIYSKL